MAFKLISKSTLVIRRILELTNRDVVYSGDITDVGSSMLVRLDAYL